MIEKLEFVFQGKQRPGIKRVNGLFLPSNLLEILKQVEVMRHSD